MDDKEKLTYEAVKRFGSEDMAQEYLDWARRRAMKLDDLERRVTTVELGMVTVQSKLQEMSADAQAARAEQNTVLKSISERVDTIVRDQILEAGRRQGHDAASARVERVAADRGAWARAILPFVYGAGGYLFVKLVQDFAAAGANIP